MTQQYWLPTHADNSSFSAITPGLQLAVDSTSMGAYKTCPRLYYYSIVLGWQPKQTSVHLTFGLLLHGGRERYDHGRAAGADHEEALRSALRWVLVQTWVKSLGRGWISDHPEKNRLSLVRTLVWYLDTYGDNDPIETVRLADGKPAVELSFDYPIGYASVDGEPYRSCGHIDRIGKAEGFHYILDLKSTGHQLTARWFSQFTPGNQFSTYVTAGKVVWQQPIVGLIVDAAQVLATMSRFQREMISRPESIIEEWHQAMGKWLVRMELSAREGAQRLSSGDDPSAAWPMNDTACDKYGGCDFRAVCSRSPASRAQWLETDYKRRVWNPLEKRGDI